MARFTVKLAKGDPFAATARTFFGVPGAITTEPVTIELTPEQAESLRAQGVIVKAEEIETDESHAEKPARKGRA